MLFPPKKPQDNQGHRSRTCFSLHTTKARPVISNQDTMLWLCFECSFEAPNSSRFSHEQTATGVQPPPSLQPTRVEAVLPMSPSRGGHCTVKINAHLHCLHHFQKLNRTIGCFFLSSRDYVQLKLQRTGTLVFECCTTLLASPGRGKIILSQCQCKAACLIIADYSCLSQLTYASSVE